MFRIASALLAASLCSAAMAQTADQAVQKSAPKQDPAANGTVNAPAENGSEPGANAVNADAAAANIQPEPVDKPLPFAVAELQLSVSEAEMHAYVHGPAAGFVGVLGLSLTWDLTHPIASLPPLLADAVVVAYGFTKTQDLELVVPFQVVPGEELFLYAQALVIDAKGFWASGIVPLAIGGNAGQAGKVAADKVPLPAAH
jgi:hypothetical protein